MEIKEVATEEGIKLRESISHTNRRSPVEPKTSSKTTLGSNSNKHRNPRLNSDSKQTAFGQPNHSLNQQLSKIEALKPNSKDIISAKHKNEPIALTNSPQTANGTKPKSVAETATAKPKAIPGASSSVKKPPEKIVNDSAEPLRRRWTKLFYKSSPWRTKSPKYWLALIGSLLLIVIFIILLAIALKMIVGP